METKGPVPTQRLSGLDASFLYLERKEMPLHMAGVFIFDGPLRFDELVRRIDAQLHLIPRYRQMVVAPPFDLGYPTWEDDPKFDIRQHIFRVHLDGPGGEAELEALSGRILSQLMDRSKPLWDLHVVDGLKGGRGALIVRIHHSLADGIAGAALVLKVMLDPTPEGSRATRQPSIRMPRRPAPKPSPAAAIASGIGSSLEHLIDAGVGVLAGGHALLSDPSALKGAAGLLPELVRVVERLPFNKPCSGDRKSCWAELDLSEVQAIRAAAGGSINDVILTVLTRALAHYVQLHGQTVAKRLIRVICPVNLRQDMGESLGNRLSILPVVLPLAHAGELLKGSGYRVLTPRSVPEAAESFDIYREEIAFIIAAADHEKLASAMQSGNRVFECSFSMEQTNAASMRNRAGAGRQPWLSSLGTFP